MINIQDLSNYIDLLRSKGVVHAKLGEIELVLGPLPMPPRDPSQKDKDPDELSDEELLYGATEGFTT
jgi:hypothetical protein